MATNMQKALSAVTALPEETQEALAHSLLQEVAHLSGSSLTSQQQAIVDERLSRPFVLASSDEVAAVHRKFQ
jgi:hypothetical protein